MGRKEVEYPELSGRVVDEGILEELVAINLLPFVERTTSSCSGHCDLYGLLGKEAPFLRVKYISSGEATQNFHNQLKKIKVTIEGRDYYLRAMDSRQEYLICHSFGIHPRKDPLIGTKIHDIPFENLEIGYMLIIPQIFNFENPINSNVTILEQFWSEMSSLLMQYFPQDIYQKRTFIHTINPDQTIDSPFRKDTLKLLF